MQLSWNLHIHYVQLSQNLHIHYVQIRPSLIDIFWDEISFWGKCQLFITLVPPILLNLAKIISVGPVVTPLTSHSNTEIWMYQLAHSLPGCSDIKRAACSNFGLYCSGRLQVCSAVIGVMKALSGCCQGQSASESRHVQIRMNVWWGSSKKKKNIWMWLMIQLLKAREG